MCGCSGSTPATSNAPASPPTRGPGSPNYYWTGPKKREQAQKPDQKK